MNTDVTRGGMTCLEQGNTQNINLIHKGAADVKLLNVKSMLLDFCTTSASTHITSSFYTLYSLYTLKLNDIIYRAHAYYYIFILINKEQKKEEQRIEQKKEGQRERRIEGWEIEGEKDKRKKDSRKYNVKKGWMNVQLQVASI